MNIPIYFKSHQAQRLAKEFNESIDPKLRAVLLDCAHYSSTRLQQNWVITCLVRTEEENQKVGGIPNSAHKIAKGYYCRAGDSRSYIFCLTDIEKLRVYVKDTWGDMVHFVYHDSGNGQHIHININRAYATKAQGL